MELIEIVRTLNEDYKTKVKPFVELDKLDVDPRYHLSQICITAIGIGEDIAQYHSGMSLFADANLVYRDLISQREPSIGILRNLEASLAQLKLAIETNNK